MNEDRPYRPSTIDLPVLGVSFEEYKTFDQAKREALKEELSKKALASFQPDYIDSDGYDFVIDAFQLRQFDDWCRYGVPDRKVEGWEIDEIIFSTIEEKLKENPNFGKLPDAYDRYNDNDKNRIGYLIQYFDEMREPHEYLKLDSYSLDETIGYSNEDIAWLCSEDILVDLGDKRWILSEAYTNAYLVRVLRHRQQEMQSTDTN